MARLPKSRLDFWERKLEGNRVRDQRNLYELESKEWGVLVIWECEIKDVPRLRQRIREFLGSPGGEVD